MDSEICLRSHLHCPCPTGNLVDGLCPAHRQTRASEPPAPLVELTPQEIEQEVLEIDPDEDEETPLEEGDLEEVDTAKLASDSLEVVCFVCGSQIFARIDGPKFYKRALRKAANRRRCRDCRGENILVSTGIVDANTRYEEDPVAQTVVAMYPEGVPGEIVAELFGVTRQRVSQIEERALRKIRESNLMSRELMALFHEGQDAPQPRKRRRDSGFKHAPQVENSYLH